MRIEIRSMIYLMFLLVVLTRSNAQPGAFELRAGKNLIPGDYTALRYQLPSNYPFQFSGKIFFEKSRTHQLDYSSLGVDVLVEFPVSIFRVGAGPTIQLESEPWVYANYTFSQRMNYGLCLEGSAELLLTDAFSLTAFVNQKYQFNKNLGRTHFVYGIGLKYSFGN
jgi:hypothetical protein